MVVKSDSQLRVRFTTQHEQYQLPLTPFVLPAKLGRSGLSDVINHLLSLDEAIPFDFMINDRLIRSPLHKFVNFYKIPSEDTITVQYFPAVTLSDNSQGTELPSWVGALDTSLEVGIAGCYDGYIKVFDKNSLNIVSEVSAHIDPIRSIATYASKNIFATASKDNTIKLWKYQASQEVHLTSHLIGHVNSVESVEFWNTSNTSLLLSGDWSGNLFSWKFDEPIVEEAHSQKKRKTANAKPTVVNTTTKHLFSIKAHNQSLSHIKAIENSVNVYTSSWDHSIKIWDLEKQDCLSTFNSSKVVTSLDVPIENSKIIASSHPDGNIRIWDSRVRESLSSSTLTLGRNDTWLSQVKWNPKNANLLATSDYAGNLTLWDIRTSVPLGVTEAHEGKALTLVWNDENSIISGGSDCYLKKTNIEC